MLKTIAELRGLYEIVRKNSNDVNEFRAKWHQVLIDSGWTLEEFLRAIDENPETT